MTQIEIDHYAIHQIWIFSKKQFVQYLPSLRNHIFDETAVSNAYSRPIVAEHQL